MTAEELAQFYSQLSKPGAVCQFLNCGEWSRSSIGPCLESYRDLWRIKPEPKKMKVYLLRNKQCPDDVIAAGAPLRDLALQSWTIIGEHEFVIPEEA